MEIFLILPHQLFNKKYLNKKYDYILWEHPHYFKKYNYNKKKLLLHFGSMKYYYDYLKKNKFNIKYVTFNETPTITNYLLFDPVDKIKLPGKYNLIETPNFLLNKSLYTKYRDKTKNFLFNAFYNFGKKELNIIPDIKSKDKYNRKTLPKNIKIPNLPSNNNDNKYIKFGEVMVNKKFNKNYGNTDNFLFPLTHKTAMKWLNNFIEKKFKDFGPYQDAIVKDEDFMFHSVLSTSINIGLLNPDEIIEKIMKVKSKIPINSFEGYIRQLFWREYQRYCYIYYNFENKNYFGNIKKLDKKWYNGTLGIEPVDNCIIDGFETGYLHHINRLMIVGNYMNLSGISPKEGHKWFMEFSCDSYEWVMAQNVYDMVFFVSGGVTMRKPYISSSNYILKMSKYKKGEWSDIWDKKYKEFLKNNKKKLWKFRYHFRGLKGD
jgi:deoxyribodipyrimidine photolyase-related protein